MVNQLSHSVTAAPRPRGLRKEPKDQPPKVEELDAALDVVAGAGFCSRTEVNSYIVLNEEQLLITVVLFFLFAPPSPLPPPSPSLPLSLSRSLPSIRTILNLFP